MKTLKKDSEVIRVSDSTAYEMTKDVAWKYCPKSEFKKLKGTKKEKKDVKEEPKELTPPKPKSSDPDAKSKYKAKKNRAANS